MQEADLLAEAITCSVLVTWTFDDLFHVRPFENVWASLAQGTFQQRWLTLSPE